VGLVNVLEATKAGIGSEEMKPHRLITGSKADIAEPHNCTTKSVAVKLDAAQADDRKWS